MSANANQQGNEQKQVHATPPVTAVPTWHWPQWDWGLGMQNEAGLSPCPPTFEK